MTRLWRHSAPALLAAAIVVAAPFMDAAAQARKPAKPPEPSCDRAQFRALLDVGHTFEAPGAISARSFTEYEFNLNLARHIERALREAGFARTVVQITAGPARPALIKRVVDANAAKPDLLISIHHDSVPDWLLQHIDEEGGPKRFSDRFSGHSIFVSYENAARAGSLQFAKLLGRELKTKGLQFTPHYTETFMRARRRELLDREAGVYRFDQLYVLRAAHMPAVLFEAGMIVNPAEEAVLAGEDRQRLIASAMTHAVEKFCLWRATGPAAGRKQK
jgi:N-acetylmuramoyl-L-alanine amidase